MIDTVKRFTKIHCKYSDGFAVLLVETAVDGMLHAQERISATPPCRISKLCGTQMLFDNVSCMDVRHRFLERACNYRRDLNSSDVLLTLRETDSETEKEQTKPKKKKI